MEQLVDIHGASEFLCLSVSTIYKLTSAKKLHHVKLNGALRFDPQKLREHIEKCSVEPIRNRD
jgi:hypothetical protein